MTYTLKSLFVSGGLALVVSATGCGSEISGEQAGVDESEMDGVQIASVLQVGGAATVFNTGGVGLNLRSGPGTGYKVVVLMPEGAQIQVVGAVQNAFYKVQYGGQTGWAHSNYLRPVDSSGGGGGSYPGNIHWNPASSANFTPGRSGGPMKFVVIHDMEGSYDGSISWFKNPASQVSAHYCIRSSDGDITQMVREQDTAWHAGNWPYNQTAIGIEHEGWMSQPTRWYTETMYRRSAQLTAAITKRYSIAVDRSHVIGHNQVPPPSTHTDPGTGWDWNHYMSLVHSFR